MRHTGDQVILGMLCHSLPFHDSLNIFLHLIQVRCHLTEFIQRSDRNLRIKIPLCNIFYSICNDPNIFHIIMDQIIKTQYEHKDSH